MAKEPGVKSRIWREKLLRVLPAVSQLGILVVVAVAILQLTPFTSDQLTAFWSGSDLPKSHWPTALLLQRTFAQEHRLPLWNPYYAGGQPLAADPLAALFYPPTHLVHLFSLRDYYLILITGHLVFAGLGMLLLARRALGLSRLPALVAAIALMATPRLISHLGAGHITIVQTVAWFPWLALACWATVREPRRWGVALGICFALTLLAGHPQMAYYGLLMTGALASWLLAKRWRMGGWQTALKSVVGLVAAGTIGVLLAAIYLLPLAEFTALSTRQLSVSSTDTYPLRQFLFELFDQKARAVVPWEGILTPGLVVLFLALLALVLRWHKTWPLLLGVVLVAGLAMGNSSPFYLLTAHILPDLDRFRGLARIWFVALVSITLLAGIGTESLLHVAQRVSSLGAVAVGLLVVLAVALPLVHIDQKYTQTGDTRVATTPSLLAKTASQLADTGRIYDVQGDNISQANAVLLKTRLASGWNPLLIQSYVSYMQHAGGYTGNGYLLPISYDSPSAKPNAALLGLMNVSVVISRKVLTDPRFVQVGVVDGVLLYKNTADAGPAYLVSPESNGKPPTLDQMQQLNVVVHAITQAPEQEIYTFTSSTKAYLVLATPSFPGWIARLDGHDAPIQQIDGVLPAIQVGPGTHTLSYSYAPSSVRIGAILSGIGLLAVLAWLIVIRFWKPGKRRSYPEENREEVVDERLVLQPHLCGRMRGKQETGGRDGRVSLSRRSAHMGGSFRRSARAVSSFL